MVVALIVSKDCSQVDRVLVEALISLGIVAVLTLIVKRIRILPGLILVRETVME